MTAQEAKTVRIPPEWTRFYEERLRVLADGAHIVMPLRAVIFRVDKAKKQVVVICEHSQYAGEMDDILSTRILNSLGYKVVRQAGSVVSDDKFVAEFIAIATRVTQGTSFVDHDLQQKLERHLSGR